MTESKTTAVVPIEPTPRMLRAYRSALREHIQSVPPEMRAERWGLGRKRKGSHCYDVPDNEKAIARWKAMIRASQDESAENAR